MPTQEALDKAIQEGLDLVEVAPQFRPPCLQNHGLWEVQVPDEQKAPGGEEEEQDAPVERGPGEAALRMSTILTSK